MKRSDLFVWAAISLLLSCKTGTDTPNGTAAAEPAETAGLPNSPAGRYSLASGKVTTEMQLPGGIGKNTGILYFTGHGEKEMRENITEISMGGRQMRTNSRMIIRDGYVYTWVVGQPAGNKYKLQEDFDPSRIDYRNLSKALTDKFRIRQEGTETILGKTCQVYTFETEKMKGRSCSWENIPMKTEITMGSGKTLVSEVTALEEDPDLDASLLELPAGMAFTEIQPPVQKHL